MNLSLIKTDKKRHLPLLLLADEQESTIDRYLERGDLYVATENGETVGVCVVTDEGGGVFEIKNLAVAPARQRQGIGQEIVRRVRGLYAGRGRTLRVGTGDVPSATRFYERCGFARAGRIPGFFTRHYDHPMVEDGVLLTDMVILEMTL